LTNCEFTTYGFPKPTPWVIAWESCNSAAEKNRAPFGARRYISTSTAQ
jgi:hypothetical protein